MEKLFIHLMTRGIEYYEDTQGTLREIHRILDTPEDVLYQELQQAYQQAHRKMILRKHGVPMDIGEEITTDPKILDELLKTQVTIERLKKLVKSQIAKHEHPTNKS